MWLYVSVFCRSLVMSAIQVSGGLPTGRLCGVTKYLMALCAGVSGSSRRMWPNRARRRFLILELMGSCSVMEYSLLLLMTLGYFTLRAILSSLRWKESRLFSRAEVRVHVSELYSRIGSM